jgi:hypothetical protein
VKRAWKHGSEVLAYTTHEGPATVARRSARGWDRGLAVGWAALLIPLFSIGCPCADKGNCPPVAVWADVVNVVWGITIFPLAYGLIRGRRWALPLSIATAGLGIPVGVSEIAHGAAVAYAGIAGLSVLGLWSLTATAVVFRPIATSPAIVAPVPAESAAEDSAAEPAATAAEPPVDDPSLRT